MDYTNFKKKWGQNFIRHTETIVQILEAIEPSQSDSLLEIGPGGGAFSDFFLQEVKHLTMIEVDQELVQILDERYQQYQKNYNIINKSILDLDPVEIVKDNGINKIFGALPYNISKKIIEMYCTENVYSAFKGLPYERVIFILQKEVAHQIANTKEKSKFLYHYYGLFNEIYLLADLEKSLFIPQPKVDSSVIMFVPKPYDKIGIEETEIQDYKKFVTNAHRNPRKKMLKTLKSIYRDVNWLGIFIELGLTENARVEELSLEEIINLFKAYKNTRAK
jgi:16S rRNA (adenine1518-N6/adenine1519-N6)-dimethyltransferase